MCHYIKLFDAYNAYLLDGVIVYCVYKLVCGLQDPDHYGKVIYSSTLCNNEHTFVWQSCMEVHLGVSDACDDLPTTHHIYESESKYSAITLQNQCATVHVKIQVPYNQAHNFSVATQVRQLTSRIAATTIKTPASQDQTDNHDQESDAARVHGSLGLGVFLHA